jgi:hypothetical protein
MDTLAYVWCKPSPLSPPLSPSPSPKLSPSLSPPSPPLSPSPLYGCSEILQGGDGFIQLVIKNNKLYFSYTKVKDNSPKNKRLKSKRQSRRKRPYTKEKVIHIQEKEVIVKTKDELDMIIYKLNHIQIKE